MSGQYQQVTQLLSVISSTLDEDLEILKIGMELDKEEDEFIEKWLDVLSI